MKYLNKIKSVTGNTLEAGIIVGFLTHVGFSAGIGASMSVAVLGTMAFVANLYILG